MRLILLTALVAAGCGRSTSLRIDVSVRAGDPAPSGVWLSVFNHHRALVQAYALPKAPPGAITIRDLPDADQPLRVALWSTTPRLVAGAPIEVRAGHAAEVALTLSTLTGDGDGDGVADFIDDCPTVPDADQADARGDGVGDACRAAGDLGAPGDLSVGDGGSGDGGADLAMPLGAPSLCATSGLAFCDGFESGSLSMPPWTSDPGCTVDTAHPRRGSYDLRCHLSIAANSSGQDHFSTNALPDPAYVRFFMYLPASGAPQNASIPFAHFQTAAGSGVRLVAENNWTVREGSYNVTPSVLSASVSTAFAFDTWECIEIMLAKSDGGATETRVWWNDVEIPAMQLNFPLQAMLTPILGPGLTNGATPLSWDVWFDEIAIDSQRIGCSR